MRFLKAIRANDWWNNKIPGFLSIGYGTLVINSIPLSSVYPLFIFFVICVAIGAAGVSMLNNIADIKEDTKSGKDNSILSANSRYKWIFPLLCGILVLIGMIWFMYPDWLSLLIALSTIICFVCYSIPPLRLKEKGFAGVLCDAFGAHLFPSIFIISFIRYREGIPIIDTWFILVAIFSLLMGLRGILWHQYMDLDNDRIAGVKTFAVIYPTAITSTIEDILMLLEVCFGVAILIQLQSYVLIGCALLYILLLIFKHNKTGYLGDIILSKQPLAYDILMLDYYEIIFPITLLLAITHANVHYWPLVPIHVILFYPTLFSFGKKWYKIIFRN